MYKESMHSISLMKMNAYYQDKYYRNNMLLFLVKLRTKATRLKGLFVNIGKTRKHGFHVTLLQVKAYFKPSTIEDHRLQYSFNHSDEIYYQSQRSETRGRIVVYTSIYGNYDQLLQPLYRSPLCDYFAFTDQSIPQNGIWKKGETDKIQDYDMMDSYHKAKYIKFHPHVMFPEYEYSIWVDGNVQIVADLVPLVDRMKEDMYIGAFMNPLHNCIYTEARYNIFKEYADSSTLEAQVGIYRDEGFPENYGMREFSVIVRKHNHCECVDLMKKWWTQVNTYTMRDQISLPYVLWKKHKTIDTIQLLGQNWRWNPRFMWYPHNWHIKF